MAPIETTPGHMKQLALSGDAPQAPPALLRVLQEATGPTGKIDFDAVEAAIVREAVGFLTDPYMDSSQLMNVTDMGARGNEYYEWNGDIPYDARRRMIGLATRLAIFSPPAHHALRLHWTYTLGTGIPRPTSKDEDVQKIIDDLWDDPANFELTTYKGQTEIDTAQQLTGEIFIAIFVDTKTGHCRFRAVPAVDVIEIISDPDDFKRPLYYKVRLHNQEYDFEAGTYLPDNGAAEDDHVFYRDWRNTVAENDPYEGKVSRPPKTDRNTEVYLSHWPLNRIGARGISDFVSASVWINQHKTFMNNRAILTDALAKISFVKTVKGGPAIVSASAGAEQSSLVDNLYGGYEKNPPQAPGSMYVKNQGVDIEQMKVDTGASNATQDGEQLAQMFSTAIGLPTHYSLMSTEAHRLATVTVMELPVLKMYLAAQQFWLDMFRGLIDFSMLQCAIARTLKVPLISRFGQQVINWTALRAPAMKPPAAANGAALRAPKTAAANGATKDATSRNGAGGAVREAMDPIEVHGQTAMQAENDQPDAQNEEKAKQRGVYTIDMPPILEKDVQQTITSITTALQAGLLTPEQAAYQVMIALSFEEVSDKLDEWRRYVELQAIKIQQQDTEEQQMNRAGLAAKNVKPPPMAAPGGAPPANGAPDGGSGPKASAAVARESAADAAEDGSVMVAVFPDAVTSRRLARYGNEPAADMHVTLCYIGKSGDLSADQRLALHTATAGLAARYGPLEGHTGAVNTFPPSEHSDNKEVVWVDPDVAGLPALRAALTRAFDAANVPYHDDFERYIPHITVEYRTPDDGETPDIPPLPLRFDALTVCIGPDRKNYALDGEADAGAVREAGGGGHWVTIEEDGISTHIFITTGGLVTKGPKSLIGAHAGHLPEGPRRKVTHHAEGHVPQGHNEHPEYHEHAEKVHVYGKWGPGKGYDVDNPVKKLTKEESEAGLKTAISVKKEHDDKTKKEQEKAEQAAKEKAQAEETAKAVAAAHAKQEQEAKDKAAKEAKDKADQEEAEKKKKEDTAKKLKKNLENYNESLAMGEGYHVEYMLHSGKYHVISNDTSDVHSEHDTEEAAEKQLALANASYEDDKSKEKKAEAVSLYNKVSYYKAASDGKAYQVKQHVDDDKHHVYHLTKQTHVSSHDTEAEAQEEADKLSQKHKDNVAAITKQNQLNFEHAHAANPYYLTTYSNGKTEIWKKEDDNTSDVVDESGKVNPDTSKYYPDHKEAQKAADLFNEKVKDDLTTEEAKASTDATDAHPYYPTTDLDTGIHSVYHKDKLSPHNTYGTKKEAIQAAHELNEAETPTPTTAASGNNYKTYKKGNAYYVIGKDHKIGAIYNNEADANLLGELLNTGATDFPHESIDDVPVDDAPEYEKTDSMGMKSIKKDITVGGKNAQQYIVTTSPWGVNSKPTQPEDDKWFIQHKDAYSPAKQAIVHDLTQPQAIELAKYLATKGFMTAGEAQHLGSVVGNNVSIGVTAAQGEHMVAINAKNNHNSLNATANEPYYLQHKLKGTVNVVNANDMTSDEFEDADNAQKYADELNAQTDPSGVSAAKIKGMAGISSSPKVQAWRETATPITSKRTQLAKLSQKGVGSATLPKDSGPINTTMLQELQSVDEGTAKSQIAAQRGQNLKDAGVTDEEAKGLLPLLDAAMQGDIPPDHAGATPHDMVANRLVKLWARTSADHHKVAVAMQRLADQMFGTGTWTTKPSHVESHAWNDAEGVLAVPGFRKTAEAMLHAQYDATQAHFKEKGITHITMFRGEKRSKMPKILESAKEGIKKGEPSKASSYSYGSAPKWQVQGKLTKDEVRTNPLSSWALTPGIAARFCGDNDAASEEDVNAIGVNAIYAVKMPVSRVLSTFRTGLGCMSENEFVVIGHAIPMMYTMGNDVKKVAETYREMVGMENKGAFGKPDDY